MNPYYISIGRIGDRNPLGKWCKLGFIFATEPTPYCILGLGFISFELHLMPYWMNSFDIDALVSTPLGYAGVEFTFTQKDNNNDGE